ncbi:Thioredoxin [Natronincola peptidivorans]|uniref:Thioredoxin n=1 Tax=Natronincola peptidivorans TaxID=426128 RepID=A0A1I0FTE9_9FIRM|nr:thioredoxin family protein [Natronincola peptidivorans]SET61474.1 Thioredoxin [Natronincola peptidivorans]
MENFRDIEAIHRFVKENKYTMLYFSLNNCGVCEDLLPKIKTLLKLYPQINCGKIEADKYPETKGAFSIFTFPCILFYIDGKELIREARFISINQLEEKLKRYFML